MCIVSHFVLTCGVLARLLSVDAEEAQSKIEELRDQEYNERRSAILT